MNEQNEREFAQYIKRRFIVLIVFAIAALILLFFVRARADEAQWSPPEGMVFKSLDNSPCHQPTERDVIVQACDWGPQNSDTVTGTVYFRVCKTVMEPQPFLVANYEENVLMYIGKPGVMIDGPVNENLRDLDHDYLFFFLEEYETQFGGCEST